LRVRRAPEQADGGKGDVEVGILRGKGTRDVHSTVCVLRRHCNEKVGDDQPRAGKRRLQRRAVLYLDNLQQQR
jgi:hypothetical protein